MPRRAKWEIEQILDAVQGGMAVTKKGADHDFYVKLYPPQASEADLADAVGEYPELHPRMAAIVETIIDMIPYKFSAIWAGEEEQAGSLIALALALYDKIYCQLFARLLEGQDLDHDVHQNEYIETILGKWGLCEETALILMARRDNASLQGQELMQELVERYGEELDEYLDDSRYNIITNGEEIGPEHVETGPAGYTVKTESKRHGRVLTLNWDEGGSVLLVSYYNIRQREAHCHALRYSSPDALQEALAEMEAQCVLPHYTWKRETGAATVHSTIQYSNIATEAPTDLMAFFAAK